MEHCGRRGGDKSHDNARVQCRLKHELHLPRQNLDTGRQMASDTSQSSPWQTTAQASYSTSSAPAVTIVEQHATRVDAAIDAGGSRHVAATRRLGQEVGIDAPVRRRAAVPNARPR